MGASAAVPRWFWLVPAVLALLAMLSVQFVNGRFLYYYDSIMYLDKGGASLNYILPRPPAGEGGGGAASRDPTEDGVVNATRMTVYAIFVALMHRFASADIVPFLHALLLLGASGLAARVILRAVPGPVPPYLLATLPLIFASAGSLPFYVAFLMPDVLTGLLFILLGCVALFATSMRPWEWAAAFVMCAFTAMSHPSFPPLVALAIPGVALFAALSIGRKWYIPTLFVIAVLASALAERKVFEATIRTVVKTEVEYFPFLTVRLISDGPGYDYLRAHCPDPSLTTCKLFDMLEQSDDPYRLSPTHMMFSDDERLGSLQRLPLEDRIAITAEQRRFVRDVAMAYPVDVIRPIVDNTLDQLLLSSVEMTIPDQRTVRRLEKGYPEYAGGRLLQAWWWFRPVHLLQSAFYLVTAVLAVALIAGARNVPGRVRMFGFFLLLGVLANAFICGAGSQPADRYGGRAIWILPYVVAFIGTWSLGDLWRRRRGA